MPREEEVRLFKRLTGAFDGLALRNGEPSELLSDLRQDCQSKRRGNKFLHNITSREKGVLHQGDKHAAQRLTRF